MELEWKKIQNNNNFKKKNTHTHSKLNSSFTDAFTEEGPPCREEKIKPSYLLQ